DGIRDRTVTGVQTCALPISDHQRACETGSACGRERVHIFHFDLGLACGALEQTRRMDEVIARSNLGHNSPMFFMLRDLRGDFAQIGRASCRERVESSVVAWR